MNRTQRRSQKMPLQPIVTLSEAYERCPYRSLISLIPGTQKELLDRFGAAFCAVGGAVHPIDADMMEELVDRVCAGQTVVVFADRSELRDAAKSQLMAAVQAARVGAAGFA